MATTACTRAGVLDRRSSLLRAREQEFAAMPATNQMDLAVPNPRDGRRLLWQTACHCVAARNPLFTQTRAEHRLGVPEELDLPLHTGRLLPASSINASTRAERLSTTVPNPLGPCPLPHPASHCGVTAMNARLGEEDPILEGSVVGARLQCVWQLRKPPQCHHNHACRLRVLEQWGHGI